MTQSFESQCRRLEREGFTASSMQWCDVDATLLEVARALHPDGSYRLYLRKREKPE